VIAAVASLAATRRFSVEAVAITLAYALGAGTVLLGVAIAARRGFDLAAVRARAPVVRRGLGGVIAAVAVLMIFGLDTRLAAHVPGYTRSLQGLEESAAAQNRLGDLLDRGAGTAGARVHGSEDDLRDFGRAPEFEGIRAWLNSTPLTLEKLRGKVVLIDFWTYSCVNCLRTLPHLARWYETYVDRGLVVVGVHTPEFAFEAEPGNVRRAVADLHIRYPVALDSDYRTWTAWGNRYWPAKYLVDRRGHVRYVHFGEGRYEESEDAIRTLLAENNLPRPVSPSVADTTPSGPQTPELYLGYARLANLVGSNVEPDKEATYEIPTSIPLHTFGYGGRWTVEAERIVAGKDARLELHFEAAKVHLVLGTSSGPKSVTVALDGNPPRALAVNEDRLYTLAEPGGSREHLLELRFSPGTEAYAFTFG
jgi:thiol-disulfide isomerase/thioredoxin